MKMTTHFHLIPVSTTILFLLLLQSALQPLVGFGLLYDFVPQSSIFTLLSPVSHSHLLQILFYLVSHVPASCCHPEIIIIILFALWSSFFASAGIIIFSLLNIVNFSRVRSPAACPTPCPRGPGCLSQSGSSPLTFPAREALPVATLPPAQLSGSFDQSSPPTTSKWRQIFNAYSQKIKETFPSDY